MAQPITIVGTITDSSGISKQVTITGIGSVQVDPGYGVPLPPPHPAHPIVPGPVDPGYGIPGPPSGILGGEAPPHAAHPIAPGRPPVATPPIYYPPEIWPKPPEVPEQPPVMPPGAILPPGWSWYYTNIWGWVLVWRPTGGGGKPQPPGGSGGPSVTPH